MSTFKLIHLTSGALTCSVAALLAACGSVPLGPTGNGPADRMPASAMARPANTTVAQGPQVVQEEPRTVITNVRTSSATTPRAYRSDAATHLYGLNRERIYKGRLPPLLHAVAVLQVEVGPDGNVRSLSWMRAPSHAPEVVAEIERTVRAAAPFPAPAHMGRVVYTDTWLWHKSGRFQLDTLTEGQD